MMAMAGRHQRGEEGFQPGRLQEHEGHVSVFTDLCSFVVNDEVFDNGIFWGKFSHDLPRSELTQGSVCRYDQNKLIFRADRTKPHWVRKHFFKLLPIFLKTHVSMYQCYLY